MERIELRKNWKALSWVFDGAILCMGLLAWRHFGGSASLDLLAGVVLAGALVITALIGVLVYVYQPDLVLDQRGIRIEGRSEVVPYEEIRNVELGLEGMRVSTSERALNISNFYKNYSDASEFLKSKVFGRFDLSVTDRRRNEVIFLLVALGILFFI